MNFLSYKKLKSMKILVVNVFFDQTIIFLPQIYSILKSTNNAQKRKNHNLRNREIKNKKVVKSKVKKIILTTSKSEIISALNDF